MQAGVSMHSSAGNRGDQHAARMAVTGTGEGPDGAAGPFPGCPLNPDNVVAIAGGGGWAVDLARARANNLAQRASFP